MTKVSICLAAMLACRTLQAATTTIDGGVTYQVVDGFGVNANHRSWNNNELKPVIDALIDEAGMTLFRVVYDNANWETTNDNADSNVADWAYYNSVYSSAEFEKLWDLVAYLNSRGITNGAFFNFMGWAPSWMGGDSYRLTVGLEDEWAEMITSLLLYARNARGLQFQLVAPDNEPDLAREGISIPTVTQYTNALHKLAVKLNANSLGDVRLVGPDLCCAGSETAYMPQMMADPLIMASLAHFGVHSYGGAGGSGVYDYIRNSAYPDRTFWITEFNVWCTTCDSGVRGTYDWSFCRGTADYLLGGLANNASAGIVWEGYDSYYVHSANWSFYGLIGVDDENAPVKTYTPRKNFYTVAQISRWVRPGAQRIRVSGSTSPFSPLLAFKHTGLGQIAIVGINTSASPAILDGTLASLPVVPHLDLHYTSATTNLAFGGSVTVTNGSGMFSATIPADCVFTLEYGLSRISITPTNALLAPGNTRLFTAVGCDTQGHVLDPQPVFSWSVNGGGTVDPGGLFTAGNSASGLFNLIASSAGITATVTGCIAAVGTIGITNEGTLPCSIWNNGSWIYASRVLAPSNVAVSAIHARVGAIHGGYNCAIYADAGGNTGSFLQRTEEVTNPVAGWHTFPFASPIALTAGKCYWLAISCNDTNGQVFCLDHNGALGWGLYSYDTWPDPITLTGSGTLNGCIYATGVVGQSGRVPPLLTISKLEGGSWLVRSEGVPGNMYRIECAETLTNPEWQPVVSGTADDFGAVEYTLSPSENHLVKYFRAVGM